MGIQEKLFESGEQKVEEDFLESFAEVIGDHWLSLASLFSLTTRDIEEIKRKEEIQQPLCMMKMWSSQQNPTYRQLHQMLQTRFYLFH